MNSYTADDVLALAKRHHNTKRTYLLINPLQAKHLPVSPSRSLEMMTCLGAGIAKKYPSAKLVIGFAETATAIAAAAAGCLGSGCKYIHTTREPCGGLSDWICFSEEHSHAVEQRLFSKDLAQWIDATPQIIFVDDEISTGKTLLNIVEQMRSVFPAVGNKQIVAASVISRLSPEHEARFRNEGIESEFLVKLGSADLTAAVSRFDISPAEPVGAADGIYTEDIIHTQEPLMDPRLGVDISEYISNCQTEAEHLLHTVLGKTAPGSKILVLGTEECMYPALILGREIERSRLAAAVSCHATTRSPIGICDDPSYPIRSGYKIHSFYDAGRETYIYDLAAYDMAVVFSDNSSSDAQARADISKVLRENGCQRVLFIEGGRHVQFI